MDQETQSLIDNASIRPAGEIKEAMKDWLRLYKSCDDPDQKQQLRYLLLGLEFVLMLRERQEI